MTPAAAGSDPAGLHEATSEELRDWDDHAVDAPGGHVYQSLAWARECVRMGWQVRFLRFEDGFGVLSAEREWPLVGGRSAYLPRGPVPSDPSAEQTAARVAGVTAWLAARGADVVATDAEVPASTGYPELLGAAGFVAIPEIQPSRHRLSLPLPAGTDEPAVFAGIAKQTRQRIRSAEKAGVEVVRHDACAGSDPGEGFVAPAPPDTSTSAVDTSASAAVSAAALDTFYGLLEATGERRHFTFGPREEYVRWWRTALAAGHLVLLEGRAGGETIAGLVLYRHGGRLSTVHSGDRAERRREHPGALHLLRWRASQLAIRERCSEMDLGGVDVEGARREPREGEPMYGLYQHKRSFGATWVEMTGAHERVIRPGRYRLGRVAARLARAAGGARRSTGSAR